MPQSPVRAPPWAPGDSPPIGRRVAGVSLRGDRSRRPPAKLPLPSKWSTHPAVDSLRTRRVPQLQVPRQSSAGSRCGTQLPPKPDCPYPHDYRPDHRYVPPKRNSHAALSEQQKRRCKRLDMTANKTPSNVNNCQVGSPTLTISRRRVQ